MIFACYHLDEAFILHDHRDIFRISVSRALKQHPFRTCLVAKLSKNQLDLQLYEKDCEHAGVICRKPSLGKACTIRKELNYAVTTVTQRDMIVRCKNGYLGRAQHVTCHCNGTLSRQLPSCAYDPPPKLPAAVAVIVSYLGKPFRTRASQLLVDLVRISRDSGVPFTMRGLDSKGRYARYEPGQEQHIFSEMEKITTPSFVGHKGILLQYAANDRTLFEGSENRRKILIYILDDRKVFVCTPSISKLLQAGVALMGVGFANTPQTRPIENRFKQLKVARLHYVSLAPADRNAKAVSFYRRILQGTPKVSKKFFQQWVKHSGGRHSDKKQHILYPLNKIWRRSELKDCSKVKILLVIEGGALKDERYALLVNSTIHVINRFREAGSRFQAVVLVPTSSHHIKHIQRKWNKGEQEWINAIQKIATDDARADHVCYEQALQHSLHAWHDYGRDRMRERVVLVLLNKPSICGEALDATLYKLRNKAVNYLAIPSGPTLDPTHINLVKELNWKSDYEEKAYMTEVDKTVLKTGSHEQIIDFVEELFLQKVCEVDHSRTVQSWDEQAKRRSYLQCAPNVPQPVKPSTVAPVSIPSAPTDVVPDGFSTTTTPVDRRTYPSSSYIIDHSTVETHPKVTVVKKPHYTTDISTVGHWPTIQPSTIVMDFHPSLSTSRPIPENCEHQQLVFVVQAYTRAEAKRMNKLAMVILKEMSAINEDQRKFEVVTRQTNNGQWTVKGYDQKLTPGPILKEHIKESRELECLGEIVDNFLQAAGTFGGENVKNVYTRRVMLVLVSKVKPFDQCTETTNKIYYINEANVDIHVVHTEPLDDSNRVIVNSDYKVTGNGETGLREYLRKNVLCTSHPITEAKFAKMRDMDHFLMRRLGENHFDEQKPDVRYELHSGRKRFVESLNMFLQ